MTPHCPRMRLRRRDGSALLLAVLVLLLIDCVVLGTVQLAALERRVAGNSAAALRVRLAAEGAAWQAIDDWPPWTDSLAAGAPGRTALSAVVHDALRISASIEALYDGLFLVRAEAVEPPPAPGRATTAFLVLPPVIPRAWDPAIAALTATVVGTGAGSVVAAAGACDAGRALTAVMAALIAADAPAIDGDTLHFDGTRSLVGRLPFLLGSVSPRGGVVVAHGDSVFRDVFSGLVLVDGNARFEPGADISGLVVVSGNVTVDAGASIRGSVFAGDHARVDGLVTLDRCAVDAAVVAAGLQRPRLLRSRGVLPGF